MATIDEIILKAYVKTQAEYAPDELIGKSREELQAEVGDLPVYEIKEIVDSVGKVVDASFEDGGRWSNYETTVYRLRLKLVDKFETVYVSITREVPATEMQDGGDFMEPEIEQVYPHKIETVVYKSQPQKEESGK